MVDHTKMGEPSPWRPEKNQTLLALLGKASEEAAELINILCRAIIQGIEEKDPKTDVPNIIAIQDEVADMEAQLMLLKEYLDLNRKYIAERANAKFQHKDKWLRGIEGDETVNG